MKSFEKVTFLTPEIAVTGFMTPRCLRIVKTLGFSTVINMMPRSPSSLDDIVEKELAKNVRKSGLEYRKLPVSSVKDIDQTMINKFSEMMDEIPKPTVIFSRTGHRAVTLWALAMQGVLTSNELDEKANRAGHDISRIITNEQVARPRAA